MPAALLKYKCPRILALDLPEEATDRLIDAGFDVSPGFLGRPYQVPKSQYLWPLATEALLPDHWVESDIVIIDLKSNTERQIPYEPGKTNWNLGPGDWQASCAYGFHDPKLLALRQMTIPFTRIIDNDGVLVVFADAPRWHDIAPCTAAPRGVPQPKKASNWSFHFEVDRDHFVRADSGRDIAFDDASSLGRLLRRFGEGAEFTAAFEKPLASRAIYRTIGTSKFGASVSGIITFVDAPGMIVLLPRIRDISPFLHALVAEVLPELVPGLFPDLAKAAWLARPEYELASILRLRADLDAAREEARAAESRLLTAIEEERSRSGFLHDLLCGTGRTLVVAVHRALEVCGFSKVVDVDMELESLPDEDARERREDLQIHDTSPVVLVEVKGIGGLPSDDDALRVEKYVAPRMREWDRTDVHGLTIINHQRFVPPMERDNDHLFRDVVLVNAADRHIGLMTTWDLHRLARSCLRNGWNHDVLRDLFTKSARIKPVPSHYEQIGIIEKVWPKAGAVAIRLESGEIALGDRVAFQLPSEFIEETVQSLRIDDTDVESAQVGQRVGVVSAVAPALQEGVIVFRIVA